MECLGVSVAPIYVILAVYVPTCCKICFIREKYKFRIFTMFIPKAAQQ